MSVATSTTNGHREVGKPRLKRSMGLWMATALVVGNMVGSGIFTLPAVLAGEAGPASILALVFTGIGAMLLALVFANLGRAHPRTGGPYYFARRAFGDFVGFQTAWAYWIAAWVGNAAIAVAFAGYLGVFWGDVNTTNWLAALVAIGAIWLFTLVNILGARETGVAQVLTTVLKFVPLAVIGLIGLFYIKGGNYTPFTPADGGFDWHINAAATLALWAFIGLESATVPAEEVKDPEKTIPRATILGTLATTLLYLVALVAIVGVLSQAALAGSSAPFADAANAIWGGTFLGLSWGKWIALVAMAATLGALNGWIMLTARVSMAAADDGLFPKPFARVHGEAPDAGLRAHRLVRPRQRTRALQLERQLRGSLHGRRPARDLDDADRLRVRGGGRARPVLPRAGAVHLGKAGARLGDRRARVCLLGLGDLGIGRGVAREGLHAAALRDPGLHLDEVAPGEDASPGDRGLRPRAPAPRVPAGGQAIR